MNKAKAEARQVRVLWELYHCTERGGGHFRTLPKITRRLKYRNILSVRRFVYDCERAHVASSSFKGLKENWTKQTGLCVSEFWQT